MELSLTPLIIIMKPDEGNALEVINAPASAMEIIFCEVRSVLPQTGQIHCLQIFFGSRHHRLLCK